MSFQLLHILKEILLFNLQRYSTWVDDASVCNVVNVEFISVY